MDNIRLIIVIGYFAIIFGIGFYASRFVKSSTDFLLAGRKLGLLLTTATLAATHFGGGFVMGGGQDGYDFGLSGIYYAAGTGLGLIFLGLIAAKPLRKLSLFTVTDYLEMRYNSKIVRVMGALLSLVAIVGIVAAQVGATRGALTILGVSPEAGAVVATILFIAYTAFAGMWGVTLTDSIQLIIIFIGLPVAAVLGMQQAGGWAAMQQTIAALPVEGGADAYFSFGGRGIPIMLGVITPVIMYDLIGQDFYQRLFSAKDENTARNGALLAGVLLLVFGIFPVMGGMAARAIFAEIPETASALPMLISEVLPVGLGAIVVAAILAAVMSTADSLLIAGTSHVTNDFYVKLINPEIADDTKKILAISRLWTVILGIAALFFALAMPGIISVLIFSYTMYASGVFVPVVLGILWKGGTEMGAITAIIAGSIAGLAGLQDWVSYGDVPNIAAAGAISLVVYVVVSLFTPKPEIPEELKA
ncbi:sodium:solute symporter family protein [Dethiobacter alkaliphilus]|uniref:sodium:solute symporter family protein n=1 Tax=Dethiobacter alkaliphilus TaxID=427926 RepID=UPI002226B542|nr:sodium:solute symporter family protein [Dethiobacter alkaliphilus]MCW3489363.1 sodium:solute symporter family protein [Dethiobacter alkaliphilus]